jgi:hypothetical protein
MPFHEEHLAAGEALLAFIPYADTLLSIVVRARLIQAVW